MADDDDRRLLMMTGTPIQLAAAGLVFQLVSSTGLEQA